MASRFSFGIFGQGSGDLQPDLSIEIKTAGTSTVLASTSAGTIIDNGDGTYYSDSLSTGKIDVYVAGALQSEMEDQMVVSDDIKTHMDDTTKHRVIDDSAGNGATTKTWSANKIYDYTNSTFEDADSTILKEGEVDDTSLEFATTLHIKDGGVVEGKIGSGAVTTGKLGALAVTNTKMAINSVGTTELIDGNVTTAKIADGDVTTAKIANDAIDASKIDAHTGYGVIAFGSDGTPAYGPIGTSHLDDSLITTAKIGDDQVTQDKMADDAIGAEQIKAHSGFGAVLFNTSGTPSFGEVDTDHLADGAVTSDKLNANVGLTPTDDTVDPEHIKTPASGTAGHEAQSGTDGTDGVLASVPSYIDANTFGWIDIKMDGLKVTDSSDSSTKAKTLSIDQSFTSENYISSDKSLKQNMDILDQRLGYLTQFSGTEGLYTVLATSDYDSIRDNGGTYEADPDIKIVRLTDGGSYSSGTFYTFKKVNFYKVPDYRQMALYARVRVSSSANDFSGKFQLTIGGYGTSNQSEPSDAITTTDTSGTVGAIYFDLTNHSNYDLYTVNVQGMFDNDGNSGTKQFEILEWSLVAKRQITVVGGQTSQYKEQPVQ
jgi:hypothetical protein